ncbi:MAG: UDP-N-acetylmuramate--alanine ligase [Pseudomonadota bacterium]|jgi:UDP-N-acetylmuramate--alanine ligase
MLSTHLNKSSNIIHFVGIGGIGMSGIAEVMHNMGYHVQGSDLSGNYNITRLEKLGVKVFLDHKSENVINADYVVLSSAIKSNNPEVVESKKRHIHILKRSEMLAELLRFKTAISISGSHGKTTTTSLTAAVLEAAKLSPTVINGGIINNKATNAYVGNGEYVVAEADESDGTFIRIPSTIAVITNIDPEHLDYYGTFENLISSFRQFILNIPFYGFAVACIDHPTVRELVSDITERTVLTYGISNPDANVFAYNIRNNGLSSTYDVKVKLPRSDGALIIENITLSTPGEHNVLNSLSAIAIAVKLDLGPDVIRRAFRNFTGVKRRFTKVGEWNGVVVIDDYAHHPEEVKATLKTAKAVVNAQGNGKVIAFFQPHRYSRLHNLFDQFVECFNLADILYIADVYAAGESAIEGCTNSDLVEAIGKKHPESEVYTLNNDTKIESIVRDIAKPGDIILMMGAGSITYWAADLAPKLSSGVAA